MRPFAHAFHVLSDQGQRNLWSPSDLAERYRRRVIESGVKAFDRGDVSAIHYNRPGIIKNVDDGSVYYTVVEKIQDASRRGALAVHTMVFRLEDLLEDGGVLLPPESKEEYQGLGLPSELHSHGRRLANIQGAIDRFVETSQIPTRQVSPGWNTRELNWILGNRRSIISDPAGDFSPEAAIAGFLAELPPLVSAGLSFAAGHVPSRGSFHIAAHAGSSNPASSRGVSVFTSRSAFRASVESAPEELVMHSDWERGFRLALTVTGDNNLEVLDAFRNGFHREGNTQETIAANLIAQSFSPDAHLGRTLNALEGSIEAIRELPEGAKEVVSRALASLTGLSIPATEQVETLIKAFSPAVSEPLRPRGRDEAAKVNQGTENIQAESSSSESTHVDMDRVRDALENLKKIIERDAKDARGPEVDIEAVSSGVRTFTGLVITGGPTLFQDSQFPGLMQELGQEIDKWMRGSKQRKERLRLIREAFGYRKDPAEPSIFDDLMYITWQTRHLKEHASKVELYNKLMDRVVMGKAHRKSFWGLS